MELQVSLPLCCWAVLLLGVAAQDGDVSPAKSPAQSKKDKRGLFGVGSVFGYDPFTPAGPAPYGVAVSPAGAYGGYAPAAHPYGQYAAAAPYAVVPVATAYAPAAKVSCTA